MNVVIYARVSKEEEGLQDPANQLIPLREYAEKMSWTVTKEYIDRCSGGNSDRPAFKEMMNEVRQRHIDIVLVWALDRFSREGMSQTLSYIEQLKHYKTGLISYQERWIDTTNPGVGDIMLAVMSWVAAEERKRISDRTKAALHKLKLQGKKLGRPRKVPPVTI